MEDANIYIHRINKLYRRDSCADNISYMNEESMKKIIIVFSLFLSFSAFAKCKVSGGQFVCASILEGKDTVTLYDIRHNYTDAVLNKESDFSSEYANLRYSIKDPTIPHLCALFGFASTVDNSSVVIRDYVAVHENALGAAVSYKVRKRLALLSLECSR